MMQTPRTGRRGAFTLVELMTVLAVLALLTAAAAPALRSVSGSADLTGAGQLLAGKIALARQLAVAQNREVQVRFFQAEGAEDFAAVQLWGVSRDADGDGAAQPLEKKQYLPRTVTVSGAPAQSPLLWREDEEVSGTAPDRAGGTPVYAGFRFLATGRLAGAPADGDNFLTLRQRADRPERPRNPLVIEVNPLTGKTEIHRL